jgi:hypothetical protein
MELRVRVNVGEVLPLELSKAIGHGELLEMMTLKEGDGQVAG